MYTWTTSKRIYEVFTQYSLTYRLMIIISVITCFALISIYLSVGLAMLCCLFVWICLIDMYDRLIPDILLICVLCNLCLIQAPMYAWSLVIAAILISMKLAMEAGYKKTLVGWGDMKLITLCLIFTPIELTPVLLFISGGVGLIMAVITRSRAFPFALGIVAGFLSVFIFC